MSDHWKSLADLLGAPGLSSSPKTEPTPSHQPAAAPAQANTPAPVASPAPAPQPEPPPAPIAEEPAKPKKRSSWEALANLFNIGGGAAEPVQPKAEPVAAKPAPVPAPEPQAPAPELLLFKPAATEPPNTALTEMFGEASSKPHESWGKPRRVVNDVDWEDDEPTKSEPLPEVRAAKSLDIDDEADLDSESSEDEPVRRSRRRRRRGRGGRTGDDVRGEDAPRSEESPREEAPRRDSRDGSRREESRRDDSRRHEGRQSPRRDEDRSREAAKGRSEEPDSRWGRLVGDEEDDDLDMIEVEPTSVEEVGEDDAAPAERRSRRRRRRRGRGRSSSDPAVASDDSVDDVEEVNRGLLGAEDETDSDDDVFGNPEAEGDSTEPSDVRRRRRRKRGRGGKRTDEPRSEVADEPIDGEADGLDAELAGDEESGGNKHRNIPTWEDSLASIIEANIENHRRNEGRGGGGGHRGGGRPRGRR